MGQMGNQMFEVAAGYAYALDHHLQLRIPQFVSHAHCWDIESNYRQLFHRVSSAPLPFMPWRHFRQEDFSNYTPLPMSNNLWLHGLFQTERYFAHRRAELLNLFSLEERWEPLLEKYPFLRSENKIGIHMRIYYEPKRDAPEMHHTFGGRYIQQAIQALPPAEVYVVASNNIAFARKILSAVDTPLIFMEETDRFDDLLILSKCDHLIGTNSTLSWWAAWLGAQEGRRCIFPLPWLRGDPHRQHPDLLPDRWESLYCPEAVMEAASLEELSTALQTSAATFKN